MSAVAERTVVAIRLEAECLDAGCAALANRMQAQLGVQKYSRGVALMPVPESVEAWHAEHRTARKRADRAARLGYTFAEIDRSEFADDIYAINVSKAERQGRPMSAGYTVRHDHGPLPDYPCSRHAVRTYGVLHSGTLYAYLSLYVVGRLHLVSMILGHAQALQEDVMYALFEGVVRRHAGEGGFFYYNRWDSGTDGLRYYKSRLGFFEGDVSWVL